MPTLTDDIRLTRARKSIVVGLPLAITVTWLLYVSLAGHWPRIVDNWRSVLTMVFGSFVAGSTPQGGGAVAFPVFTKILETPAAVARTFSLSIQAVGMVTAAAAILLSGKRVEWRAVIAGGAAGAVGFLTGLFLLGNPDHPFWASRLPEPYVKVTFTLAYIVYLALDEDECGVPILPTWTPRVWAGTIVAGFIGGTASALLGSGVDVLVFLFIVIVAGLHPRVGVPTSVLAMAAVSMLGFVVLGIIDGQLATTVVDGSVVAVGGAAVAATSAARTDIFGMWIAAVPIVVWGAPVGTHFVHRLGERRLIQFLAGMAAIEVLSTAIFLPGLWTNPILLTYGTVGMLCILALVRWLYRSRSWILGSAWPVLTKKA
ncbi:MAG: TSUP family transporter [Acidimicrobiia bacterium]